jgi:hypothetical protein
LSWFVNVKDHAQRGVEEENVDEKKKKKKKKRDL